MLQAFLRQTMTALITIIGSSTGFLSVLQLPVVNSVASDGITDISVNSDFSTIEAPAKTEAPAIASSAKFKTTTPRTVSTTTSNANRCANYYAAITFNTGHTVCITTVNGTGSVPASVAGLDIANAGYIGSRNAYLLGHNYNSVFAPIKNGNVTSFTITLRSGETHHYQIVRKEIYNCNVVNQTCASLNAPNGNGVGMLNAIQPSRYLGTSSNAISLMTCHGSALPGNSATQRFVAYAIEI
jgi:type V secretory pathway adhesin AidA